MVQETISRIENTLKADTALSSAKKQDLLNLVGELKKEVTDLAETHREDAGSIVGYTEASFNEAIRKEKNPELLSHSLDGLALSARRFEVSHPRLVGLINTIGQTLWKIGI
jgi:hypothetical protein